MIDVDIDDEECFCCDEPYMEYTSNNEEIYPDICDCACHSYV